MLREAVLREIAERDMLSNVGWCCVDDVCDVWVIGTSYMRVDAWMIDDVIELLSLCSVKPGRLELCSC